jgi:predicted RNA-binding Zn ribbon-like protein
VGLADAVTGKNGYMLLRAPDGVTFRFDPGARCLEFAHTGGEGFRAVYETLHQPADLAAWLAGHLGTDVVVDGPGLAAAKALREAIWACADARVAGTALPPAAVAAVNAAAARPPLVPAIGAGERSVLAPPVTLSRALATFARDAVALFTDVAADRFRQCAGANCRLIFADTSRSGRRRWCSMERCGNRAKATSFRTRRRERDRR